MDAPPDGMNTIRKEVYVGHQSATEGRVPPKTRTRIERICAETLINEFDGVAGMRRIADRCRVLWPFIKDPPFPQEQEQDFNRPCPAGWTPSGASPNDVYCNAPETYSGRCKSLQNFTGIGPEEKVVFAHLCHAPWPLKGIPTNFDFNYPCPKGWDFLRDINICKAPPPPAYVPTDDCPSTVPSFGIPEKNDAFPNPTTPFDNTDTISESTLRKFEFMRKCHVDWPAVEAGQRAQRRLQPVIFHAMNENLQSKSYICPGGYHSVKGYNVPMCVENSRANSTCAPLLFAGKVATSKDKVDFLSKYGDCVKVA
eukprot:GEMP01047564.1.p1 GENE.GEMP01047564.1~~GEMP01047564.1.p1  ORF type:complete len:311 (+),score=54.36 GEMP01047564.1:199-1131(+)